MGLIVLTRISEFQVKDIVNISDGKKLGNMSDLEINTVTGKIEAIIVSEHRLDGWVSLVKTKKLSFHGIK